MIIFCTAYFDSLFWLKYGEIDFTFYLTLVNTNKTVLDFGSPSTDHITFKSSRPLSEKSKSFDVRHHVLSYAELPGLYCSFPCTWIANYFFSIPVIFRLWVMAQPLLLYKILGRIMISYFNKNYWNISNHASKINIPPNWNHYYPKYIYEGYACPWWTWNYSGNGEYGKSHNNVFFDVKRWEISNQGL